MTDINHIIDHLLERRRLRRRLIRRWLKLGFARFNSKFRPLDSFFLARRWRRADRDIRKGRVHTTDSLEAFFVELDNHTAEVTMFGPAGDRLDRCSCGHHRENHDHGFGRQSCMWCDCRTHTDPDEAP